MVSEDPAAKQGVCVQLTIKQRRESKFEGADSEAETVCSGISAARSLLLMGVRHSWPSKIINFHENVLPTAARSDTRRKPKS